MAREQSSLLRGCWQPAERRGRLPVPALPAAHPAPPAQAPMPMAGAALGSLWPCLMPAELGSQQSTPGRVSCTQALPGTWAAATPQVPALAQQLPGGPPPSHSDGAALGMRSLEGCGAEHSSREAAEATGAHQCMAVPTGKREAAPRHQALLARWPAREPRGTRSHGRLRHPGPLTGAG